MVRGTPLQKKNAGGTFFKTVTKGGVGCGFRRRGAAGAGATRRRALRRARFHGTNDHAIQRVIVVSGRQFS